MKKCITFGCGLLWLWLWWRLKRWSGGKVVGLRLVEIVVVLTYLASTWVFDVLSAASAEPAIQTNNQKHPQLKIWLRFLRIKSRREKINKMNRRIYQFANLPVSHFTWFSISQKRAPRQKASKRELMKTTCAHQVFIYSTCSIINWRIKFTSRWSLRWVKRFYRNSLFLFFFLWNLRFDD